MSDRKKLRHVLFQAFSNGEISMDERDAFLDEQDDLIFAAKLASGVISKFQTKGEIDMAEFSRAKKKLNAALENIGGAA